MEEILTKEIAQNLMKLKGEARGTHFINDAQYVKEKEGEQGLKKVIQELRAVGYPIEYSEIQNTKFYPIGLRAISLLAIKKSLGWDDEQIRDLCRFATKVSLIVRLYLKFFYSIPKMVGVAPKLWKEYFTIGLLEVIDFNEKEKRTILRVKDFKLHDVYCRCLEGYLGDIVKMIVGAKEVNCKETKCPQDNCHEFIVTW